MKLSVHFFQLSLAFETRTGRSSLFPYTLAILLLAMTSLGSLSSCQRAPQAYFAPTAHPAAQRASIHPAVLPPATDSLMTASLNETLPLTPKPLWQQSKTPSLEASLAASNSQPARGQSNRRVRPDKSLPPACDQLVLRSGDVIEAKVKEVGVSEIRYKKCDRPDGPDYTIAKRDVLSIKYSNGEVERFTSANANSSYNNSTRSGSNRQTYESPTNSQNEGPRTDPFAIVAIAAGGLAIFTGLGSLLLGATALVFGALSLSRIRKEPNRFKGRGLAMAGMIIGIVAAAATLLYVYVL